MWPLNPLHYSRSPMNIFHHSGNIECDARLDVRAQGIHHQQAYFDARVFNPLAASYIYESPDQTHLSACFGSYNREKR